MIPFPAMFNLNRLLSRIPAFGATSRQVAFRKIKSKFQVIRLITKNRKKKIQEFCLESLENLIGKILIAYHWKGYWNFGTWQTDILKSVLKFRKLNGDHKNNQNIVFNSRNNFGISIVAEVINRIGERHCYQSRSSRNWRTNWSVACSRWRQCKLTRPTRRRFSWTCPMKPPTSTTCDSTDPADAMPSLSSYGGRSTTIFWRKK